MNDIFSIQNYSSRLALDKAYSEKNPSQVYQTIGGKLSSSSIEIPRNIREEISQDPEKQKLYNASVEFESVFVNMMMKEMRKSIQKNDLFHGGYAEDIFEDFLYDEYSRDISKSSKLGLAEKIYSSMVDYLPSNENPSLDISG
jgi:flagellar protein FlgJ